MCTVLAPAALALSLVLVLGLRACLSLVLVLGLRACLSLVLVVGLLACLLCGCWGGVAGRSLQIQTHVQALVMDVLVTQQQPVHTIPACQWPST